jgi:hypothetical protein
MPSALVFVGDLPQTKLAEIQLTLSKAVPRLASERV